MQTMSPGSNSTCTKAMLLGEVVDHDINDDVASLFLFGSESECGPDNAPPLGSVHWMRMTTESL